MEKRIVPLNLLQDLSNFLQTELPMVKARSAVEALEFFMKPEHAPPSEVQVNATDPA